MFDNRAGHIGAGFGSRAPLFKCKSCARVYGTPMQAVIFHKTLFCCWQFVWDEDKLAAVSPVLFRRERLHARVRCRIVRFGGNVHTVGATQERAHKPHHASSHPSRPRKARRMSLFLSVSGSNLGDRTDLPFVITIHFSIVYNTIVLHSHSVSASCHRKV